MEKTNNATGEGQLDFNAPLMSVRRISGSPTENEKVDSKVNGGSDSSSKPTLPLYRSDLKSGPLRDPGTVPFVWEQTPGRPKDEQKVRANYNCPSPRAPRLPPGRILSAKQSNIETPEPPKAKSDNEQRNGFPGKHTNRGSSKISANSNDTFASRRPCAGKPSEDDLDSDGCDDFSDAVETLSQTESAAVPYSVSVVSGMEGYDLRQSVRSVDAQTRNFMMDRFLPAAKAMASESPQQSSRRLPVKPITSGRESRGPSPLQSRPYTRKPRAKEKETDEIAVFSSKACGLFPRRLRSAFSNSSPISQLSRMKKKKHFSLSPALNRRNSRGHLSDGDPFSDSDGETWEAIYRQKLVNGSQSTCYLRKGNETRAFSASASPEMGIMSRISCGSDSQTLNKFGTPTSGGISPYRNEPFRSPFSEGTGFLGFPKADKEDNTPGVESMRRSCNSLNDMGPEEDLCFWKSPPLLRNTTRAGSVSPTIEKTVYVDHVHKTRSSVVKHGYFNHNEPVKASESDSDVKSKLKHDVSDSSLIGSMKMLEVANVNDNLKPKNLEQSLSLVPDQSYCLNQTDGSDNKEQSIVLVENVQDVEMKEGWPLGIANKSKELSDEKKSLVPVNVKPGSSVSVTGLAPPLQPPLPKSPSESWLWRAMPRTPSPSSPSQRYLRLESPLRKQQQQGPKASHADPKWETIVKSAYAQPGHLRFSEEFKYKASPGSFRRGGS